jgi:CDP-6-deoxy-D-xylo-4-hexulose-3-dehydrase
MTAPVRRAYPLASVSWGPEEVAALHRVIESGMYSMGAEVAAFEREFAQYTNSTHALMVSSGSAANLLMVAATAFRKHGRRLQRGDEVLVPAVSWSTTFYPLSQYGLVLRFVDIDAQTLNYDLEALEAAVTPRTAAIMAVNLLGNPNEFSVLSDLARRHDLALLEDNCESLGAVYDGRQAGTFGLAGSFSFFFSHHMSTMEGGMVVTDDRELYELMLSLRAHGWTRNLPDQNLVTGRKDADPFLESYKFVLPGYNLRPLEMEAAVGREQLKKLPDFIRVRRDNAALFKAALSGDDRFRLQREIGASSWFGFSLVVDRASGLSRKQVVDALAAARIDCRPIVAGDFTQNPVMEYLEHDIPFPLINARELHSCGFFVGNQQLPLDVEIGWLAETLARIGA